MLRAMWMWRMVLRSMNCDFHMEVSISETFKADFKKNLNWTFECLVVTSICFVFESIASDPSFTELLGMWSAFPLSFEMDYIFGPNIRKKRTLQISCCDTLRSHGQAPPCHSVPTTPYLFPSLSSCKSFVSMCLGSVLNK